jgi:hypothetical protein
MPDPLFDRGDNANTPLSVEEREELIPSYITLRDELNEAEQINIGAALRWSNTCRRDVLDRDFLNELHHGSVTASWQFIPIRTGMGAFRASSAILRVCSTIPE